MDLVTRVRWSLRSTRLREALVWFRHAGVRPQDAFVASYPKSGTTWLRFMLGQLLSQSEMDFDTTEAAVPLIGAHHHGPRLLPDGGRLIKTHERYSKVYRRAIYLVRDVRDVAVSYYHHQVRQGLFEGDLPSFLAYFLEGKVDGYGVWHEHVGSWLNSPIADSDRLLVVKYESMRQDPLQAMAEIVAALRLDVSTRQLQDVIAANTMERMRQKEESATVVKKKREDIPIVRKGAPGEWRTVFTDRDRAAFAERAGATLEKLGYVVNGR